MRVSSAAYLPVRLHLIFAVCVLFLFQTTLLGQASNQAQIRGVVSDATGAVMPNATVTITEADTNLSQTAKTNHSGDYIIHARD